MKNIIISACFIFIFPFSNLLGQVENELNTSADSKEFLIKNGKKKLEKKITEKDYTKAIEAYDYVNTISSQKNLEAFEYSEEILINLILCNWQKMKLELSMDLGTFKKLTNLSSNQMHIS